MASRARRRLIAFPGIAVHCYQPIRRALVFGAACCCLLGLTASTASAQGLLRSLQSARFIEAPRAIAQQLREAERSIADERYSEAVVRLGDLLQRDAVAGAEEDGAGQDFFMNVDVGGPGAPEPVVSESLLYRARRMIGELPPKGLEVYELQYGPLARKMLDDASTSRDWDAVEEVRRKYFHTAAGYDASMLLAQREWLAGRPLGAYLLLEELMRSPAARQRLDGSLEIAFAAAAKRSGRELDAELTVDGGQAVLGGETVRFADREELDRLVEERFPAAEKLQQPAASDYRMLGGSLDRNGGAQGEMPLANPRWTVVTTASPRQERTIKQRSDEMTTRGELPPPSFLPLKVGDQLLMRTTERLVGVDYKTGKRVWQYPWYSAYEGFDEEQASFDAIPGEEDPGNLLSQRVWNDLPFGQMSSDGKRVFVLDDLGEVEMATFSPIVGMQGTRPADIGRNTLVALDLETEGKLLWRIGAGEDQSSRLSDAFFLGPPLPLNGRLYVLIEIAGDICLSCLDPRTGSEHWRQQLVAIETGAIDMDPVRRVAGAMPTYHRGVLICPTGAGAVVAFDLVDRMLRWGRTYDRNAELNHSLIGGNGLDQSQLMQRWFDGVAIAVEDSVVLTPIEADRLYTLDLLTGEQRFPEKNRVRMRYLAGVRDGRMIVVGSGQVRAYDMKTGDQLWTTPSDWLSAGQQVSGIGVFGDADYLLPTTTNELVRISLSDGAVLERRTTRYPLGNLIATGGELISQSPTKLAVAFGERSLEPIVNELLSQDPNHFEAMVRKAELLIQEGKRDEALEYLARARAIDPDNDEVYMLSVTAMLGSLRESPELDGPLVELLERLIDQPSQRVELLALRVNAGIEAKAWLESARLLIQLSELLRRETSVDGVDMTGINDPSRQCILDCWVEARMSDVYSGADESQRREIDAAVETAVASLTGASSSVLQQVLRHMSPTESISRLRNIYGRRMLESGELLQAERTALGIQPWSAATLDELSDEGLQILAQSAINGGFGQNAAPALSAIDFEAIVRSAPEQAAQLTEAQQALAGEEAKQWPKTASLSWESQRIGARAMPGFSQSVAQTVITGGPAFEGWKLVSEYQNPYAFRDADGQLHGIPLDGISRRDDGDKKEAIINGSVAMLVTPTELICVDLFELMEGNGESILWRRDWSGDSVPVAKPRSETTPFGDQIYRYHMATSAAQSTIAEFRVGPVLGDRVLMLQGGDLVALDLFSSEPLWRNSDAPRSGAILAEGRHVAVVSPEANQVAIFDALDGAKLETRPWAHGTIWAAQNRYALAYSLADASRRSTVRLVDVFSNTVLHEMTVLAASRGAEATKATYGRVVDGRYLVMLNTEGDLRLWDVQTGRDLGSCELPAMPDLQGLHAMQLDGQLIVLPRRPVERAPMPVGSDVVTTAGQSHQGTSGVFAVSLADASLRWSFEDGSAWGCTLTQPAATPILLLSRSRSLYSTTGSRRRDLDVIGLDVRDGNVLTKMLDKQVSSQSNELETRVVVQPVVDKVVAQIGGELLTFTFGEPAPE